ncbi:serine protease 1 isoform X3 [Drosophila subobscura]|uniref:serine protease 1 isoform X3 n=1 Tax=Drosophila subobscura TaxID=7241 RepID=UPI00155A573B|nr:serine protease 1 isoform X3 [Drosophila subobscura]
MKVLVVFALALASASAGLLPQVLPVHPRDLPAVPSIEGRITNGKDAVENQFPYQVSLNFGSNSGGWFCGGSIISPEWILTAAHCTSGASSVTIGYGATVRTSPVLSQTVTSGSFSQHESYNSIILRNDISLIKTPAVSFTAAINKINLPAISSSYSTYEGQTAVASGYGKTSDASNSVASHLQYADLTVISNKACENTFGTLIVTPRVICVGTYNGVSTCNGDSGGPLAADGVQIGVVSFGSSAGCEIGSPAGFTRTTYFLDWIAEKTGISY